MSELSNKVKRDLEAHTLNKLVHSFGKFGKELTLYPNMTVDTYRRDSISLSLDKNVLASTIHPEAIAAKMSDYTDAVSERFYTTLTTHMRSGNFPLIEKIKLYVNEPELTPDNLDENYDFLVFELTYTLIQ